MAIPMTTAALRSEIQADPASLGYAAFVSAGDDSAIASALNLPRAGAGYQIYRNDISQADIIKCIVSVDFKAATQLQMNKLQFLFPPGVLLDATAANTRQIILDIFAGASATTTSALSAVATRAGSRAEVLFGAGAIVTSAQVSVALRGD